MERRKKGMKAKTGIAVLIIVFSLFLFSPSPEAQEKKGIPKGQEKKPPTEMGFGLTSSRAPIDIVSDTVEADQKQSIVTFKGNVIAKQEDTTLYANTLVIYYDQEKETQKLKKIVAMGNVKVVRIDRRATSKTVTFHQEENKVVFDGDAVVREGENVIRGERITYYVDEERSVVEGGKGARVNTRIIPPPKEEEEGSKAKPESKK
jgi:lipopolysaccharide export system protein LptA